MIDDTHDPARKSWVESANQPGCDFPIQNLPLGVFRTASDRSPRAGVAIGDYVLDLRPWLAGESLNEYMSWPTSQRRELRQFLSRTLEQGSTARELIALADCEMLLPAKIGDYTDFYASLQHALNIGRLFRPDNPLLPNYKHVPIAYGGRSSSIVLSGTPFRRPWGQVAEGQFAPTSELDFEVELGFFAGPGNRQGEPIPITDAEDHLAGVSLLNDWSARDIQRWEYQPLGPFLGKNFATSISPWMITMEALAPFRTLAPPHNIAPLPYLQQAGDAAFDITLEVHLRSTRMAEAVKISLSFFKEMFWTPGQMVAHHTSNGCPLRPGDLLGSGTISGPEKRNGGCLMELTLKGTDPLPLPSGETRSFLENGDEIILSGCCLRESFKRIGFGACSGIVLPADR